jgi:hypothetical protein
MSQQGFLARVHYSRGSALNWRDRAFPGPFMCVNEQVAFSLHPHAGYLSFTSDRCFRLWLQFSGSTRVPLEIGKTGAVDVPYHFSFALHPVARYLRVVQNLLHVRGIKTLFIHCLESVQGFERFNFEFARYILRLLTAHLWDALCSAAIPPAKHVRHQESEGTRAWVRLRIEQCPFSKSVRGQRGCPGSGYCVATADGGPDVGDAKGARES